jgi:hypothetical protein
VSLTYVGQVSVGAAVPGAGIAISAAVPDLEARITALLAFNPGEISLAAQLQLALNLVAMLQEAITLGIVPPSIAAQIAIIADLLGVLQAKLALIQGIVGLFGRAGAHAYAYTGGAAAFGTAMQTELTGGFPGGGPADSTAAIVIAANLATNPELMEVMSGLFAGF